MSQSYVAKKPTVSNFWKHITFCCEKCGSALAPEQINTRLYYACEQDGLHAPVYEIENAVNRMAKEIVDEAEDGCQVNLKNMKWSDRDKATNKTYYFTVTEHKGSVLRVNVATEEMRVITN